MNSVHVDENEDHGWVVGQCDRGMDGERVAVRARWVPMKCQWLRDGVTIVEVVSTVLKHQNGHVDKTHNDDFIAARSQQGLNSLNSIRESRFHTRALVKVLLQAATREQATSPAGGSQNPDARKPTHRGTWLGWWQGDFDV